MNRIAGFLLFVLVGSAVWAGDTTISGGRVELREKGEAVYFSGGVRLERDQDIIKASEMETNKSRNKINARGKVQFFRKISSSETCVGYGDRAFYHTDKGEGYLIGSSTLSHVIYTQIVSSTITQRVDIFADRFDFLKAKTNITGTGHVYGYSTDAETGDMYEFWADKADYLGTEKKIVLKGTPKPHAEQTNAADKKIIYGNVLTYNLQNRDFTSKGESSVYFIDFSTEAKRNYRKR